MEKTIFQLPFRVLSRYSFYQRNQFRDEKYLRDFQVEKLKRLLIHADKNVPFYRKLFQQIKFDPTKFENLEQMNKIPLLEKETVRTRSRELIADNAKKFGITWDSTSGSTGTPLKFILSNEAQANKIAALLRCFGWAGYKIGMRSFCVQSYYFNDVAFKKNSLYNILRFDSNKLKKESCLQVIQQINRFKPKFFLGFPFDLLMMARYAEEAGIHINLPKSILTYGETLSKSKREQLENYFKCKVYNFYSLHEGSAMIGECEKGNMHLIEDFAYHELIAENGNTNLVGTNLYNYSMPLIRYNIKDNIIPVENAECSCGRHFRMIKEIQGKACDYLQTPDGRVLGAVMSHSIDQANGVIQSQIIQTELHSIEVNLIADESFNFYSQNKLELGLRKRLGNEMSIKFHKVSQLEKRPGGKTPFIISKIGNEYE
jgi:phenylacetate-coenzyme A ligase PaaK-like adenylate-forming protein